MPKFIVELTSQNRRLSSGICFIDLSAPFLDNIIKLRRGLILLEKPKSRRFSDFWISFNTEEIYVYNFKYFLKNDQELIRRLLVDNKRTDFSLTPIEKLPKALERENLYSVIPLIVPSQTTISSYNLDPGNVIFDIEACDDEGNTWSGVFNARKEDVGFSSFQLSEFDKTIA